MAENALHESKPSHSGEGEGRKSWSTMLSGFHEEMSSMHLATCMRKAIILSFGYGTNGMTLLHYTIKGSS